MFASCLARTTQRGQSHRRRQQKKSTKQPNAQFLIVHRLFKKSPPLLHRPRPMGADRRGARKKYSPLDRQNMRPTAKINNNPRPGTRILYEFNTKHYWFNNENHTFSPPCFALIKFRRSPIPIAPSPAPLAASAMHQPPPPCNPLPPPRVHVATHLVASSVNAWFLAPFNRLISPAHYPGGSTNTPKRPSIDLGQFDKSIDVHPTTSFSCPNVWNDNKKNCCIGYLIFSLLGHIGAVLTEAELVTHDFHCYLW